MPDTLPEATVTAVYISIGPRLQPLRHFQVHCPFCSTPKRPKTHLHGWPLDSTHPPATRVSHCAGRDAHRATYQITGLQDAPVKGAELLAVTA